MTEIISRPESPELDDAQMEDLRTFFSNMNETQLREAMEQTIRNSESD